MPHARPAGVGGVPHARPALLDRLEVDAARLAGLLGAGRSVGVRRGVVGRRRVATWAHAGVAARVKHGRCPGHQRRGGVGLLDRLVAPRHRLQVELGAHLVGHDHLAVEQIGQVRARQRGEHAPLQRPHAAQVEPADLAAEARGELHVDVVLEVEQLGQDRVLPPVAVLGVGVLVRAAAGVELRERRAEGDGDLVSQLLALLDEAGVLGREAEHLHVDRVADRPVAVVAHLVERHSACVVGATELARPVAHERLALVVARELRRRDDRRGHGVVAQEAERVAIAERHEAEVEPCGLELALGLPKVVAAGLPAVEDVPRLEPLGLDVAAVLEQPEPLDATLRGRGAQVGGGERPERHGAAVGLAVVRLDLPRPATGHDLLGERPAQQLARAELGRRPTGRRAEQLRQRGPLVDRRGVTEATARHPRHRGAGTSSELHAAVGHDVHGVAEAEGLLGVPLVDLRHGRADVAEALRRRPRVAHLELTAATIPDADHLRHSALTPTMERRRPRLGASSMRSVSAQTAASMRLGLHAASGDQLVISSSSSGRCSP